MQDNTAKKVDMTPAPVIHSERIGDTVWKFEQARLHVFDDIRLWSDNPRILPELPQGEYPTEEALETALMGSKGYDTLSKSIREMGQLDPIYVWRKDGEAEKYIVLEGSTRVTILRDLARKSESGKNAGKYNFATVKILPPEFGEKERAILLAKIHVRGDGVRSWTRYTQAKFIYDHVEDDKGLMSVSELAGYMGKSIAWVQRLRDAYRFALKFIEQIDEEDGVKIAMNEFSTLEEISKATGIGPQLREFDDKKYDGLRDEVFTMVRKGVFKEYRDARFLKQFHEDPDKWAQLKTGEPGIASKLAAEIKHGNSSIKAKIVSIDAAVERAVSQGEHGLDEEDATHLKNAAARIMQDLNTGIDVFRLELMSVAKLFDNATKANVQTLQQHDLDEFRKSLQYFNDMVANYGVAK